MELKSERDNLWLMRIPSWVRVISWVGVPFLFVCAVYILLIPVIAGNFELLAILATTFLGLPCLYMAAKSYKVFPYLRSDIEFNELEFTIYFPSKNRRRHLWSEVSLAKSYTSVQVLELFDQSGKSLLVTLESSTSFQQFMGFVKGNCKHKKLL